MESYVVRIYRRAASSVGNILGIVEKADTGASTTFKSFEELYAIFFPLENEGKLVKKKQIVEQRKYRRFLMKEGTLTFNSTTDVGVIEDISMGGLSFKGPKILDDTVLPQEIGILCDGNERSAGNIQCRKIVAREAPSNPTSRDQVKCRKYSVEFGDLTPVQQSQLQNIIQNFTLEEV